MKWIPVAEQMPDPGKPVMVAISAARWYNPHFTRAVWVPKNHFEDDDLGEFQGDLDWSEDGNHAYWPEGWYEWNEYEETHWQLGDNVTHWAAVELPYKEQSAP